MSIEEARVELERAERTLVEVLAKDRDAIIQGHLYVAAQKMAEARNLLVKVHGSATKFDSRQTSASAKPWRPET